MTTPTLAQRTSVALKSRRSAEMYKTGYEILSTAPLTEAAPLTLKLARSLISHGSNAMAIDLIRHVGETAQANKQTSLHGEALTMASHAFNKLAGTPHALFAAAAVLSMSTPNSKKHWQPAAAGLAQISRDAITARNPHTAYYAALALATNINKRSQYTGTALTLLEDAANAAQSLGDYPTAVEANVALAMMDPTPRRYEQVTHNLAITGYGAGYKKDYVTALTAFENALEIAHGNPGAQLITLLHANTLIDVITKGRNPGAARPLCETLAVFTRHARNTAAFKNHMANLAPDMTVRTDNTLNFAEKALTALNARHQRLHGESIGGAKMA